MISISSLSRLLPLLFLFSVFVSNSILAQENDTPQVDSLQVKELIININDIPQETERLGQRIIKLKEILKPSATIKKVDSVLILTTAEVIGKRDSLYAQIKDLNRRDVKVKKVVWENYKNRLKDHQETLKDRTEDVSAINDEIVNEITKWKNTKNKLLENNDSSDVYEGLDDVIATLQEVLETIHTRLDSIFLVQNGLTEVVLIVDEVLAELDFLEFELQKDYFSFDGKPIWALSSANQDSTQTNQNRLVKQLVATGVEENKAQLKEFIQLNRLPFIAQIAFIIFLFVLMIRVHKNWNKNADDITNPIEVQSKIVLSHPLSSAIVSGVLISSFFYDALIPSFAEIHIVLILLGTFFLLPKLTNTRFNVFLALLFLVYLTQTFQAYIGTSPRLVRWLLLVDAVLLVIAFIDAKKVMNKSPEQFKPLYKIFKKVSPVYIFFLLIAILANCIGMVSLSTLLVMGVVTSTIIGLVISLTVKVIASLLIFLFKLRKESNLETLTIMVNATHKRIQPILLWIGFGAWIMFTLKGFDLSTFIFDWVSELMIKKWEIGQTVISLGGILAFASIFIITLLLAKLVATILQDEWMINVLPRGLASAISLLLRIILVAIGFYIAVSAAGIDLSKLGFIIGALGVGIGFGLQNVVLNFISGLILAFERPINLGDTIEVDQEFGVVTNIGVRSSTIKSYSGYESIIPNGDLISKKVNNYTLANRDRRSKIIMKTAPSADPIKVIDLFNSIATNNPVIFKDPAPKTYFYGYNEEGNLSFALIFWTTFSDTLKTNSEVSLQIYAALKEAGIEAPAPVRRIVKE